MLEIPVRHNDICVPTYTTLPLTFGGKNDANNLFSFVMLYALNLIEVKLWVEFTVEIFVKIIKRNNIPPFHPYPTLNPMKKLGLEQLGVGVKHFFWGGVQSYYCFHTIVFS